VASEVIGRHATQRGRAGATIAILSAFTIWITWLSKAIEMKLRQSDEDGKRTQWQARARLHLSSPDGRTCREELPQLAAFT
jgi:hypothetical protein